MIRKPYRIKSMIWPKDFERLERRTNFWINQEYRKALSKEIDMAERHIIEFMNVNDSTNELL